MTESDQIRGLLMQVSIFGLIIAVWVAIVTLWALSRSRKRKLLEARLQINKAAEGGAEKVLRLWREDQPVETLVPSTEQLSLYQRLERMRNDAGWVTPIGVIILWVVASAGLAALLVFLITGNILIASKGALVVLIGFRAVLLHKVTKRSALFEKQLVDALDLGARSLRAGHPLSGAFRLISEEIDAPLNAVFAEIVDQESLGIGIQTALQQAADRSLSPDMKIFAASVIIQLRSGGNLADMMDRVSWVIRDRMKLNRRARVLTAEAQLSKWVLLALPIGLFVALNLMNPDYMAPFYDTFAGGVMLLSAVISLAVGAFVMNKMAVLKY
jgi:tight adherence protein B